MNSNPFPAAFVNFKGEMQVWPISIPNSSSQCFIEWRMNLLTEQHAVGLMTQSMNNIMHMSLTSKFSLSCISMSQYLKQHVLATHSYTIPRYSMESILSEAYLYMVAPSLHVRLH